MPHIHDKIDFTVEVFVVFENKVLLRKHDKYGIWLSVGGHIELDEDPVQAAIREVKEETGLDVVLDDSLRPTVNEVPDYQELIPPYFLNRMHLSETHEHITLTYFARATTDVVVNPEGDERSDAMKWYTAEDLDTATDLRNHIRVYAKKALSVLGK